MAHPGDRERMSVLETIGNTPLVKLQSGVPETSADVYVKLEYFSPTGSYKDRMALSMVEEAEKRGDLKPGMTVVEYTGGSTGSSLAMVCAIKGYRFQVVSSDAFSQEKLDTMAAFGAELHLVPSEGGAVTPDLVPRMIERARELADESNTYFTDQLHNPDVIHGYRLIGVELLEQMDGRLDAFCGGVGTAGMLMGVAGELRRRNPEARIYALEPASSAVVSGSSSGAHRVEGIGIGFRPPLLEDHLFDEVRPVEERRARATARRIARSEGIFAGTSTGLNLTAALDIARELGPGKVVATVAVDTGLKYLTGGLFGSTSE